MQRLAKGILNTSNKRIILTANILFSGIGCQERGFENSGLFDLKVLNTSEISKESVVAYAAVHCGLTDEMVNAYNEYPSREEMAKHLEEINLGYIPEKDKKFGNYSEPPLFKDEIRMT